MIRNLALALLLVLSLSPMTRGHAQGLDDEYVRIFNLIQDGDNLSATQPGRALAKYTQAQAALHKFRLDNSDWNPKVVSFRLRDVADQIATITPPVPADQTPAASPAPVTRPG